MRNWAEESGLTPSIWSLVGVIIISVAVLLRLYNLDLKPLHHDEGVNGLFMMGLVQPPYTFKYDPARYHGPSLYYLTAPVVLGLGLTTFAIRLLPAMCGIATVLLAFGLRRWIGSVGALVAAALLAVSPGAVYFSRYFIHEALLVFFTFAALVAAWQYQERPRLFPLVLTSASAAMMFTTKETWIIAAGVLMIAAAATALHPLLVHSGGSEQATPTDAGVNRDPSISVQRRLVWAAAASGVFLAVSVLFYSSFFTNWAGLGAAVRGLAIWTETGTRDHVHPWYTYLRWLASQDATVLLLGLAGMGFAIRQRRHAFIVFAALWAAGMLMAYSLIPYKTPWLTLNIIVPLAVVSGCAAEAVYVRMPAAWRPAVVAGIVLIVGLSGYQSVMLNFLRYDDDRHGYVYAHTRREVLELVNRIELARARAGSPITIAVVSPEHFPLSWYLKDHPAGYYGRVVDTQDDVFIGSVEQDQALLAALGGRYARSGPYPLRPGVDLVLYIRGELRSP